MSYTSAMRLMAALVLALAGFDAWYVASGQDITRHIPGPAEGLCLLWMGIFCAVERGEPYTTRGLAASLARSVIRGKP